MNEVKEINIYKVKPFFFFFINNSLKQLETGDLNSHKIAGKHSFYAENFENVH